MNTHALGFLPANLSAQAVSDMLATGLGAFDIGSAIRTQLGLDVAKAISHDLGNPKGFLGHSRMTDAPSVWYGLNVIREFESGVMSHD